MATKAQRHKAKLLAEVYLCILVSWRQNIFCHKMHKKSASPGALPD
jgi:hypothetical protein